MQYLFSVFFLLGIDPNLRDPERGRDRGVSSPSLHVHVRPSGFGNADVCMCVCASNHDIFFDYESEPITAVLYPCNVQMQMQKRVGIRNYERGAKRTG